MRSRAALVFSLFAMTVGSLGACAAVFGFEDTTLRSGDGSTDDGQVDDDGGPDTDGNTLADGAPSRLTTTPSSIAVRRGSNAMVTVEIQRGGDVTGDVILQLTGLPTGVTSPAVTLPAAASSGKMTVTAAKTATLGAASLNLIAQGTSLPASPIPLLVEDPSGSLDVTFDADGLVFDSSKGFAAAFYAIALQSDAKIVAGGGDGTPTGWLARRFGPAGAPEATFTNAQGTAMPGDGAIHAIAIDSKGNIVCVGSSSPAAAAAAQLTIVRLLKGGGLDATFNLTGIVRAAASDFPLGSEGLGVAVAPDDSVIVSGSRTVMGDTDGILLRYNATGTRDAAFGTAGIAAIPGARLVGVVRDASGALYAGGTQTAGPGFLITKRLATGSPDSAFGTAGITVFDTAVKVEANGFARLASGDFAFAGDQGGAAYATAVALQTDGSKKFGRLLNTMTPGARLYGVAGFDTSSFIVAGHTAVANGEARVERVLLTGFPDTTFGTQGIALIEDAGAGNAFDVTLFAAAVQADGRILVAGNRSNVGASLYRLWQ